MRILVVATIAAAIASILLAGMWPIVMKLVQVLAGIAQEAEDAQQAG